MGAHERPRVRRRQQHGRHGRRLHPGGVPARCRPPTLGYQKVLKDSARVAGFAGIGSLDSWQMNEALLTCLRTAPALDHVVPLLMANHEGPLRQATQLWG